MASPLLRNSLALAALAAALSATSLSAGAAAAAETDGAGRLGQGLQSLGRRLDIAQLFDHGPRDIDEEPAGSREAAAAGVRMDRLEGLVRSLNGQVEELQHQVRRLEEQLRRTAEGVLPPPPRGAAAEPSGPLAAPGPATTGGALRRGDAFDPSRDPAAPGAPRQLGTTPPSAPLASDLHSPGAPLDLTHGYANVAPAPAAPPPAAAATAVLPTAPQSPRDEFDVALSRLRLGEYEAAEKGFSGFLAKNAKSKLAPQATLYLGESFFLRERHREAAEKFLEISTKFPSSPQAPEAMLRLGQSLHAIGAKEQACASFNEIAVKYPGAPARVKEAAQRESRKDQC
ncbi:tol-pal system protein YbgF [Methylosinus trichosporium]|uniref:Cell division coordinator CpoB n=1 Tax=Methylosinus trichosporium (strain ATCC 35070 / NCIMB 11131 / UNIQEM 75 / OB3b) TaxID=595536 RepID=A0A2D2D3T1_METT3|nr:tol-pal system protein YbgF [Methylosinus trichosporium]ATQ69653.1 tol-pal system protein YbgF [Methylosinus trichosporium OB3b]